VESLLGDPALPVEKLRKATPGVPSQPPRAAGEF
jgi:hypothetical protein